MTDVAAELALPWAGRRTRTASAARPPTPSASGCASARTTRATAAGIVADLCLDKRYESYPGVLHGGIVALVCDEAMGNLVVLRHGARRPHDHPARPLRRRRRDRRALPLPRLAAETPDGTINGRAEIRDLDGTVLATATAGYRPVPADAAGLPRTALTQEDPS